MAIYDMSRPTGEALSTRIATYLVRLAYAVVDATRVRKTQKVLSSLTEEELFDIGLTREDIRAMGRHI